MKRPVTHLSLCLAGLAMFAALAGCSTAQGKATAASDELARSEVASTRQVMTVAVASQPFVHTVESTGTALPVRESRVACTVPGSIDRILVKEGDLVRKDQPMVRLDLRNYELSLLQAEAALDAARAQEVLMRQEFDRVSTLRSREAVSVSTFDKAKAGLDATAAQLRAADIATQQARKALNDATLKAPYAGSVVAIMGDLGEDANSGKALVHLVDDSSLEVKAFLAETYAPAVRTGMEAEVVADAGGVTKKGVVTFVSSRVQEATRTFEVRITVDNADRAVKAGSFCRVTMTLDRRDQALMVPEEAVQRDKGGEPFVLTVKDGAVHKVTVKLGPSVHSEVLVDEGLTPGMRVITRGGSGLSDGESVKEITSKK